MKEYEFGLQNIDCITSIDSVPMSSSAAGIAPPSSFPSSSSSFTDDRLSYSASPSPSTSEASNTVNNNGPKSTTTNTNSINSIYSSHSPASPPPPSTLMIAIPASLLHLSKPAPAGYEADTRVRLRNHGDGTYSYISTHCQLVPISTLPLESDPALAAATAAAAAAAAAAARAASSTSTTSAFPYKFAVAPPAPPAPRTPQPPQAPSAPNKPLFSSQHAAAAQRIHSKVVFSDEDDDQGDVEDEEEDIAMDLQEEEAEDASVPPHEVIDVDDDDNDAGESELGDEMSDVDAEGEGEGEGDAESETAAESNTNVTSTAALVNIPRNQWPNTKNKKARFFSKSPKNLSAFTSFNSWLQKIHHPGRTIFECTPSEVVKIVPQWLLEAKTYTGGLYKLTTLKGYVGILTNLTKLMKPIEEWGAINLAAQPEVVSALATLRQREREANATSNLLSNPQPSSASADGPLTTRRGVTQAAVSVSGEPPSPQHRVSESHETETTTSHRAPRLTPAQEHLLFHSQDPASAYGLLWLNFFNFVKYLGSFFVDEHRNFTIKQIIVASKMLRVKYQFPNQDESTAEPDENTPFEISDESDPLSVPREVKFLVFTPPINNNRRQRRFMYERPFEGKYCPVRLWLEYLSHRPPLSQDWGPDQESLDVWWMLPKRNLLPHDVEWYATSLGKQKIGSVINTQTQKIGLPPVYNNQSLAHQPKENITLSDEELHQMAEAWASKSYGVPTREEQNAVNQKALASQKSNPTSVTVQSDRRPIATIPHSAGQHPNGMHSSSHGAPQSHTYSPSPYDPHSRPTNPSMYAGTKRPFYTTDPHQVADPARFQQLQQQMDEIFKRQKVDESVANGGSTTAPAPPSFIAANDAAAAAAKTYAYGKPPYSTPSILNAAFAFPPPLYPTSFGGLASPPLTLIPPSLDVAANLLTFVDQFQQEINQLTSYASKCQTSLNSFKDIVSQMKSDSQAVIRVEQQTAKIAQQFQQLEEQKFLIQQLQEEKEQWMKEKAQSMGKVKQNGIDDTQEESKMDIDDAAENDAGDEDLPPLLAAETANLLRAASKAGIGGTPAKTNGIVVPSAEPQKSTDILANESTEATTQEPKKIVPPTSSESIATPAALSSV